MHGEPRPLFAFPEFATSSRLPRAEKARSEVGKSKPRARPNESAPASGRSPDTLPVAGVVSSLASVTIPGSPRATPTPDIPRLSLVGIVTDAVRDYLARPKLHSGPVFTGADYTYIAVLAIALLALAVHG